MSIKIPLTPEIEAQLRQRAAEAGVDLPTFAAHLLREAITNKSPGALYDQVGSTEPTSTKSPTNPGSNGSTSSTAKLRRDELRAWTVSHSPLPYEADDSRESIYEGRGE